MITDKMMQNVHKLVYIIENNPGVRLPQILEKLQMPAIDINTALWAAQELGFIDEPTQTPDPEKNNMIKLLKTPEYDFGAGIDEIKERLVYSFVELAKTERDLEEHFLKAWMEGYAKHDVEIALSQLDKEHRLTSYQLTDPKDIESVYTFYTLYENSEQLWGRKSFAQPPKGKTEPAQAEPVADTESTTTTTTVAPAEEATATEESTTTTTTEGETE